MTVRTSPVRFLATVGLIDGEVSAYKFHERVVEPGEFGDLIVEGDLPFEVPEGWVLVRVEHEGHFLYAPVHPEMIESTRVLEIEVRIPGYVYYECFDPACTEFPREVNLPAPTTVRIGKGYQMRYRVTPELAAEMLDHAQTFGEALSRGVDDTRPGRETLRWVERERLRLEIPE